jgi:hypothetical protein
MNFLSSEITSYSVVKLLSLGFFYSLVLVCPYPWNLAYSKSPRGGMDRRKLKFTNFKHNYKPRLVLEIKWSPKERAKTNQPRNKASDTVICFTEVRFLQT